MNKLLLLSALLHGSAVFAAVDLLSPDNGTFGAFANAKVETVELAGKPACRLVLGGITEQRTGALRLIPRRPLADPDVNALTITYKGSGKPGDFVIIINDVDQREWCWNGVRWQADAMISSTPDYLQKRVFPLGEFKTNAQHRGTTLRADRIKEVYLSIGRMLDTASPERADLTITGVALEKDPKPVLYEEFKGSEENEVVRLVPAVKPNQSGGRFTPTLAEYHLPRWLSWDLSHAWQRDLGIRNEVSLNGYWQFQPVPESGMTLTLKRDGKLPPFPASAQRTGNWTYQRVPGSWDTRNQCTMRDANQQAVRTFNGVTLSEFAQGYLRRAFVAPESWRGKQIILHFSSVGDTARLFVNGVKACDDFQNAAQIDVTSLLHYGELNDLTLWVQYDGFPFRKTHRKYRELGVRGADWWFSWHTGPGIVGDVMLSIRPAQAFLEDMAILTTVAGHRLRVSADLSNATGAPAEFQLRAKVYDGNVCKFATSPRPVTVPAESRMRASVEAVWPDAVFWSPENPKLYRCELELLDEKGQLLDRLDSRFGFRELAIEGGHFTLNGKKYRLKFFGPGLPCQKMSPDAIREALTHLKEMNYNGMIYSQRDQRVVEICDELGLMLAMREVLPSMIRGGAYLPGVNSIGFPSAIYLSNNLREKRQFFEETLKGVIRTSRNNPSVVIWAINPLLCYTYEWIQPNLIDRERAMNDLMLASCREESFLQQFDPGRLVMHSMGGNTGKIIAANPYPCFSNNVEEWQDWPMLWKKTKPLVTEEISLPYLHNMNNWQRIQTHRQTPWEELRQLYFEQGARYFGDDHYRDAAMPITDTVWNLGDGRKSAIPGGTIQPANPAAVRTKLAWLTPCSNAWRFYDLSGIWPFESIEELLQATDASRPETYADLTAPGLKPEVSICFPMESRGAIFEAMRDIQKPFLARLGGRLAHFTDHEHHYLVGDEAEKTILLSNDSLTSQPVEAKWQLRNEAGTILDSGAWQGTLAPGAIVKEPIRFRLPAEGRVRLELAAAAGKEACRDSLTLTACPAPRKPVFHETVRLYDEDGRTAKLLEELGVPCTRDLTAKTKSIVVGALSFTPKFLEQARKLKLEREIRDGVSLLVMPQSDRSALKAYLEDRRARRLFVKDVRHPVVKGFTADDLRHWRGDSDKLEPYPKENLAPDDRYMHWGVEGVVATWLVAKPAEGRFRVLIDGDGDLAKCALLEEFVGKGRVLLCQLDFENRMFRDAPATELACRLFRYLENPEKLPVAATRLNLSTTNRALFQKLGFRAAEDNQPTLIIADGGTDADLTEQVRFAHAGGTLLLLKPSEKQLKQFGLSPSPKSVHLVSAELPPELLRGLGNSDFYLNPEVTLPVFGQRSILQEKPAGKGRVIALTLLPEDLSQNSAAVKAHRILAVLLTNLGVPAEDPLCFDLDQSNPHFLFKVPDRLVYDFDLNQWRQW